MLVTHEEVSPVPSEVNSKPHLGPEFQEHFKWGSSYTLMQMERDLSFCTWNLPPIHFGHHVKNYVHKW